MNYYAVNTGPSLSHWGIKDMKWGVRRFQNPDGTLTDEGRKRYYGYSNVESHKTKYIKTSYGHDQDLNQLNSVKGTVDSMQKATEAAKKMNKKAGAKANQKNREEELSKMSDDELRKKVNRMNLENQYMNMTKDEMDYAHSKANAALDQVGDVLAVAASALTVVILGKEIFKKATS